MEAILSLTEWLSLTQSIDPYSLNKQSSDIKQVIQEYSHDQDLEREKTLPHIEYHKHTRLYKCLKNIIIITFQVLLTCLTFLEQFARNQIRSIVDSIHPPLALFQRIQLWPFLPSLLIIVLGERTNASFFVTNFIFSQS